MDSFTFSYPRGITLCNVSRILPANLLSCCSNWANVGPYHICKYLRTTQQYTRLTSSSVDQSEGRSFVIRNIVLNTCPFNSCFRGIANLHRPIESRNSTVQPTQNSGASKPQRRRQYSRASTAILIQDDEITTLGIGTNSRSAKWQNKYG